MKRLVAALAPILLALSVLAVLVQRRRATPIDAAHDAAPSPEIVAALQLQGDHAIGAGRSFELLTVFPVLAKDQPDLGPFTTLPAALEQGAAEVREDGATGGTVNELVIENKGDTPIYVLAGTVVKGGKRDRQ